MTTFEYWGTELHGVAHLYNHTWANERFVELAVARHWMSRHARVRGGLEVGNVLSHYSECHHDVVDRYEPAAWYQYLAHQWVSNIDVLQIAGSYPWIVSLSTLEHIATDTPPYDHPGAVVALNHLRRRLAPGGAMLVSWPTGVNAALDTYLAAGADGATRACTISRGAGPEVWVQDEHPVIRPYGADSPHPFAGQWAEAVAFVEFDNMDKPARAVG